MATDSRRLKRRDENLSCIDRINPAEQDLKKKSLFLNTRLKKAVKLLPGLKALFRKNMALCLGLKALAQLSALILWLAPLNRCRLRSGIPAPRVQAPPEGKLTPRVDMTAPPSAPANVPEPVPGTPEYTNRRFGREALSAIGFDPKTGEDRRI